MNQINYETKREAVALVRHAAVSWIEQELQGGRKLAGVLREAAGREWNGRRYAAPTLEEWHYLYRKKGFESLKPSGRRDRGTIRALSATAREALEAFRRSHPDTTVCTAVRHLMEQGQLQLGEFSYSSIYRWFQRTGLDARSLRMASALGGNGPTKAFEAPLANDLWMADMMHGPILRTAEGKVIHTRLFAILDDCSRLMVGASYHAGESLACFLDVLRTAVARRGIPFKLYVDQGKVFVSHHLRVVCASMGCKLLHAKPYAAWSKGKIERVFRTIQLDFQQRLMVSPVQSLEELNRQFWAWLELDYHQRRHSALGTTPAARFAERSKALRPVRDPLEMEQWFLMRQRRRVRKDATLSLGGKLWEAPLELRGQEVEVRYNPFTWQTVDLYLKDRRVGSAKPCNKQLNVQLSNRSANYAIA